MSPCDPCSGTGPCLLTRSARQHEMPWPQLCVYCVNELGLEGSCSAGVGIRMSPPERRPPGPIIPDTRGLAPQVGPQAELKRGGAPGARPGQAGDSSPHGRSDRPAISPVNSPVNRLGTGNRGQVMRRMGRPRALTRGEKTDGAATISRDAAPPLPGDCTAILPLYCHVIAGTYRSIREDARHNISLKTHEHERLMDLPGTTWTP